LDRRRFVELSTLAAGAALTGCRHRRAGELTMALGWIPDVEYADLWVALDRRFIADAGLRFQYQGEKPQTLRSCRQLRNVTSLWSGTREQFCSITRGLKINKNLAEGEVFLVDFLS
jgi:hypothetical protein